MTRPLRGVLALVAVLSVLVAAVLAAVVTDRGPFADRAAPPPRSTPASAPDLPAGVDPARRFLDAYVDEDGRVVRRDQGGDTVSEGQAYAMLLAAAARDEETFDRVWGWSRTHLLRPDGLLSWTWRDGAVVDANSAADADVDAAHALVVAGATFGRADLTTAGRTLADAVLEHETRTTSLGRVLLAGQWATEEPYRVNLSYSAPAAYQVLGRATGDPRWAELADGDRAVLTAALDSAPLPPDWSQVRADGSVEAMPPPGGGDVGHGLDAQRVAVRYAVSCDRRDHALVARIGRTVTTRESEVRGVYDLGGRPRVEWQHPVALVSAAAVTDAEGRPGDTAGLLRAAATLDGRASTYYGAAWTALGEDLLEDPTTLGITCRAEES